MTTTKIGTASVDVVVDMKKCVGSGMCTTIAPSVFKLDGEGKLVVLKDSVGRDDIDALRDAVACCPVDAIGLGK